MGKKIRVKENKLVNQSGPSTDFSDVSNMSPEEFLKNEKQIMRAAGIS